MVRRSAHVFTFSEVILKKLIKFWNLLMASPRALIVDDDLEVRRPPHHQPEQPLPPPERIQDALTALSDPARVLPSAASPFSAS